METISNKTITLDNIPVIKELVKDTIDASTAQITPQILPPNAKVVYCDGDHDELKIQAAIEAIKDTGGVVYPVGECVLIDGRDGAKYSGSFPCVLNVLDGVTLDGSLCGMITCRYEAESSNQSNKKLFYVNANGRMRHIRVQFEGYDSLLRNPTALYNRGEVSHCEFKDVVAARFNGLDQPSFQIWAGSKFNYNTINGLKVNYTNSSSSSYVIGVGDAEFIGNHIKNITKGYLTNGHRQLMHIVTTTATVRDNYLEDIELVGRIRIEGDSSEWHFTNVVATFYNTQIIIAGKMKGCTFKNVHPIALQTISASSFIDCEFDDVSSCMSAGRVFVGVGNSYIRCVFKNMPPHAIGVSGGIFDNCKVGSADMIFSDGFNPVNATNGAIIKDNIFYFPTIGTADETCVVEGNITATPVKGVVSISSDSGSFTEGATLTATAISGEVENANIESLNSPYYKWEKSVNGDTWETVQKETAKTYKLTGDEGYIRCAVVPQYGAYCGAVYSEAYAVTKTEE